jgi:SOS-response transcriptional repressor LexA
MNAATAFTGRYPILSHPTCADAAFALTPRERAVLDFLKQYQRDHNGTSPTISEMCDALGYANSRAPIHRILTCLEGKRAIVRKPRTPRAIAVIEPTVDLSSISDAALASEYARRFGHRAVAA